MFKRCSSLMLLSLMFAGAAHATQDEMFDIFPTLCAKADDGRLQQEGFRVKSGKLAHPFGRTEYDGMLGKTPVAVTVGLKFGSPFCELYFPKAPKSRFEALRKALRSSIGIDGEIYDNPEGGYGFRGELWADKGTTGNGKADDLKFASMKAQFVGIQYASKGFMQTHERAGLMIEVVARP